MNKSSQTEENSFFIGRKEYDQFNKMRENVENLSRLLQVTLQVANQEHAPELQLKFLTENKEKLREIEKLKRKARGSFSFQIKNNIEDSITTFPVNFLIGAAQGAGMKAGSDWWNWFTSTISGWWTDKSEEHFGKATILLTNMMRIKDDPALYEVTREHYTKSIERIKNPNAITLSIGQGQQLSLLVHLETVKKQLMDERLHEWLRLRYQEIYKGKSATSFKNFQSETSHAASCGASQLSNKKKEQQGNPREIRPDKVKKEKPSLKKILNTAQ